MTWRLLCSDGKWHTLRGGPDVETLRPLNYGKYKGFWLGTWKDGEEAIYQELD